MSGLARGLEDALDRGETGIVRAEEGGASAEADVVESDRLGVRLRGVRVRRAGPIDVAEEAAALPDRVRSLDERLAPLEVDPGLGGAILRTAPDEVRDGEFYELGVHADGGIDLSRQRTAEAGREPVDWTMTRRQLGRLLGELLPEE